MRRYSSSPVPVLNFSYSTTQLIGKGFTSQVYKGVSSITGFPLAIKVIDKNALIQEDRRLIKSQIASMRKLRGKSPYILNLVEVNEIGSTVFIVTEQCDCDLSKVLQQRRLTQKQAIDIMQEIIKGYICITQHGIVHRDLKPANIFMKNGHVKIGDFGFGISLEQCASCHNVGSPLYMSPEAIQLTQYSAKSDIWALGVTFYEMLFGCVPWDAHNQQQLYEKISTVPITQLLRDRSIGDNCRLFLQKSLNINPNLRMSIKQLGEFSLKPMRQLAPLQINHNNLPNQVNYLDKQKLKIPQKRDFALPSNTAKNVATVPVSLSASLVKQPVVTSTRQALNSQLMLCEYFILFFTQMRLFSLEKSNKMKKTFQNFIARKLLHLELCTTQNPFNLPQLSSLRETNEFQNLLIQINAVCQKFKQTFNIAKIAHSELQSNYRQMKEQIMSNITGLFLDSNQPSGINIPVDRKFILDSLVSAYDIIRAASMDDALMFGKSVAIQQLLKTLKNKGIKEK